MNKLCDKFQGHNTCDFFISNGACSRPDKFMCHVFIDTGSQPVEDDVPLFLGEVLKTFEGAKVVEEINPEKKMLKVDVVVLKTAKRLAMEDFFGKI